MTTTTINRKIKESSLRFKIVPSVDELQETESKINTMQQKVQDCFNESLQSFFDTTPDYINPLKFKDNASRMKVFKHIEEAEQMLENSETYIMQPVPLLENISWTINPQIPIKNYELIKNQSGEFHPLVPMENSVMNLFPPLSQDDIIQISPFQSDITVGVRKKTLCSIKEETGRDDSFIKECDDKNETSAMGQQENRKLSDVNGKSSKGSDNKHAFLDDLQRETKTDKAGLDVADCITNKKDDIKDNDKFNLKFQYSEVLDNNWLKETQTFGGFYEPWGKIEDSILVCKECGFEAHI